MILLFVTGALLTFGIVMGVTVTAGWDQYPADRIVQLELEARTRDVREYRRLRTRREAELAARSRRVTARSREIKALRATRYVEEARVNNEVKATLAHLKRERELRETDYLFWAARIDDDNPFVGEVARQMLEYLAEVEADRLCGSEHTHHADVSVHDCSDCRRDLARLSATTVALTHHEQKEGNRQ